MMENVDLASFGFGLLAGSAAAALFLAGLGLGLRLALRSARPTPMLLASSAVRIALLLSAGWGIAGQGSAALAGFALGFLAMRSLILFFVRLPPVPARRTWN